MELVVVSGSGAFKVRTKSRLRDVYVPGGGWVGVGLRGYIGV